MKRTFALAIAATTALTSSAALAEDFLKLPGTFDSYVTLVSEYSFRGITQSSEEPALQGSVTWSHDSGVYLGFWGSSVDFADADIEIDFYGGFTKEVVENFTVDLGLLYYAYPGAEDNRNYDFWEVYGSLAYNFDVAKVKVGANFSPEYFADSGDATYLSALVEVPLPYNFGVSARVGRQYIDDRVAFGFPDYTDWELAVSYQMTPDLKFNVSYIDTDLDKGECADGCDARVVAGLSASF